MPRLENDTVFPDLSLATLGDKAINLPGDLNGSYAVILVYRGSWCPYCAGQLRAFVRAFEDLTAAGIQVVALSVDDEPTSAAFAEKLRLPFSLAHSADALALAESHGIYLHRVPLYLQSTGFILDPSGRLLLSVYSSGAVGRLMPDDVLGFVKYVQKTSASH